VVQAVAEHYGFSPRLLGLMRCEPLRPIPVPTITHHSRISELWHQNQDHSDGHEPEKTLQNHVMDLEGHLQKLDSRSSRTGPLDLNHYRIVNEVWYYSSVDWGHKCKALSRNFEYLTHVEQFSALATILSIILERTCRKTPRPAEGVRIDLLENGYGHGLSFATMVLELCMRSCSKV